MKIGFRGNVVLCALITIGSCSISDHVFADHDPFVRGERARLERQAYDYYYRNSNNNVFRSSRHFHPTRNSFRSSRYYKQRVAASSDGYPVRTFVRYGETINGVRRERSFDYAHHRRYPLGPVLTPGEYGFNPGCRSGGYTPPVHAVQSYVAPSQTSSANRRPPRDRHEIDMYPIHIAPIEPKQRAVSTMVEQPDGSTKLVITSTAIESPDSPLADAWRMLRAGSYVDAVSVFAQFALDPDHGQSATLGYALAQSAIGEMRAAATAIDRIDIEKATIDVPLRLDEISMIRDSINTTNDDEHTAAVISALNSIDAQLANSDTTRTSIAPE